MKKILCVVLTVGLMISLLTGCTPVPANTVFSADDLPGKIIGVQLGTTGDLYATWEYEDQGSTIERFSKGADAVLALKQAKVDCVIIDNEPAKAFVAKNKDLMILSDPFALEDYAICISKDNSVLKGKINAALATLKENGTLASIISNYIGDDTKGLTPYISSNSDYSNGTLTMATNAAFEPYEYVEDGKIIGLDCDLAQAIADILKMDLVIEDMEFDTIITAVETGKADIGVAGMTVTEDRLLSIDFTDSYTTATQVIIVRVK